MNYQKSSAPKFITRLAFASALSMSALVAGVIVPSATPVYAQAIDLKAPNVPGFADVVEAVSPAVVSVRVESRVEMASDGNNREFRFDRRFFQDDRQFPFFRNFGPRDRDQGREGRRHSRRDREDRGNKRHHGPRRFGMAQGSGFFVSDTGYIVTNNHVVSHGTKITVVLNDGTELDAKLVGHDKRSDLAVLKVDSDKKFTYVEFANKNPRIGEWVVAVGNPFGLGGTVTAGIVSANGREISTNRYDDFIQIDAAVNKGNSGGPTFNLSGKVVGINTAIFSPSGGNVGIAFAIPASLAKEIVGDLIDNGKVQRGWLGVQIQPVTREIADSIGLKDAKGAIVATAQDNSPAKQAGIKPGDVITAVNGKLIKGPGALAREIGQIAPNSETTLSLWRDGKATDVKVTLGKLKDDGTGKNGSDAKMLKAIERIGLDLRKSESGKGVEVIDVVPGSNADKRGIQIGDVIVSINGEEVNEPSQAIKILSQVQKLKRKAALFQVERDGNNRFVAIPMHRG